MDVRYFLGERLKFVRFYYDHAAGAFLEIQAAIDEERPPFDDPPYSEDGEPAYLAEWTDAKTALDVLGLSCVLLLSDTLKLYLEALRHRVIGFAFDASETKIYRQGFLAAPLAALSTILDTDWKDCPADLDVIEQVVLARNRAAHGDDLTSLDVCHDRRTLEKHPQPFFADKERWSWMGSDPDALSALVTPTVDVSRDKLVAASAEIAALADWIESRIDRAAAWRARQR